MDLIPVAGNTVEILMTCGGYLWASVDASRRLAWQWNEKALQKDRYAYNSSSSGERRFGSAMVGFFALPVAWMLIHTGNQMPDAKSAWDKPPKSHRRELKRAEQRKAYEALAEENRRMEKRLEIYEAA